MALPGVNAVAHLEAFPRGAAWLRANAAVVGCSAFVALTAGVLWLGSGVHVGEIARFVPYEAGFVVLPGWLAYRAAFSRPGGRLRQVVLGWTLGYLLETLAFFFTAQIGVRPLFFVYPLVVGVPAAVVVRRRHAPARWDMAREPTRAFVTLLWVGAFLCALLLTYVALIGFRETPLPRDLGGVTYHEDTVFALSLAAEALHHWPMTVPMVSGEGLHYHLFVYMHMAAIAQVTGIDLSVVVLRLYFVPLLVLFALQLIWAGRAVARRSVVGLVAAFAVLFLGELDVSRNRRFLFDDYFFNWLLTSHTFLLGLVFFVPTIVLLDELIRTRTDRTVRRKWALVGAFVVGCMGAKSYSLLTVASGLFVLLVVEVVRKRRVNRAALIGLVLTTAVYVGTTALILKWNTGGVVISFFSTTLGMEGVSIFRSHLTDLWGRTEVNAVLGAIYGTLGLLGVPLLGIVLWWRYRREPVSSTQIWFLSLFVGGLPAYVLLDQPGFGQLFVVFFGVVAGTVVAAYGFTLFWLRGLRPALEGRFSVGVGLATIATAGCLILGVLNTPLDWFPHVSAQPLDGPQYRFEPSGLTADLYRGLLWVRNNTDVNSILVVNNHSIYPDTTDSKYFYYSAFAQRRVVLESWDYTRQAAANEVPSLDAAHTPFPRRLRLSNEVFEGADEAAMRTLSRDYGARYLVADKFHASVTPWLAWRVLRVFSNNDIDVYDMAKPLPPAATCPSGFAAGTTALFGQRRSFDGASALRLALVRQGFEGLTIQLRNCHEYAVVLTGFDSLSQARAFQREAAGRGRRISIECRSQAPQGGLNAVFGHRRSRRAAAQLAAKAKAVGFLGLQVRQDSCDDWEVDLGGLKDAAQRRAFSAEAAHVGFHVRYEPG